MAEGRWADGPPHGHGQWSRAQEEMETQHRKRRQLKFHRPELGGITERVQNVNLECFSTRLST